MALPAAVPQPAAASSRNVPLLAAGLLGLVVLGSAIGFGVLAAFRSEPAAGPSRIEKIQRGLAKQRAANRRAAEPAALGASKAAAPAKAASARPATRTKSAPAGKTVKKDAAPQAQASATAKPSSQPRPAKFSDEPADPD